MQIKLISYKRFLQSLFFSFAEKLLTDEKFLFLYEANKSVNLELPNYEYEEFYIKRIHFVVNFSEQKALTNYQHLTASASLTVCAIMSSL